MANQLMRYHIQPWLGFSQGYLHMPFSYLGLNSSSLLRSNTESQNHKAAILTILQGSWADPLNQGNEYSKLFQLADACSRLLEYVNYCLWLNISRNVNTVSGNKISPGITTAFSDTTLRCEALGQVTGKNKKEKQSIMPKKIHKELQT